jgi:drug/metabolite transporter (DMT)-like permease
MTSQTPLARGYLIALTAVAVWSWTGILIAYLLRSHALAPMTLAFWRDAFTATALLVGLVVVRRGLPRIARGDVPFLLLYGAALTLMNVTWTWSVAWNGASVSTVLVYASPGITAVAARAFFAERVTIVRCIAFAGSLVGCVLVARADDPGQWRLNGAGIVAGTLSAVSFALYSMMGKAAARRNVDPWLATLSSFSVAAAALLPIAALSLPATGATASLLSLGARWEGWALLLLLVVPTLGGYGLYTVSLAYLPAATANLIATLEPVLTTVWAYALLGESLDARQLAGGGVILASVLVLRLDERPRPVPDACVPSGTTLP